MAKIDLSDFSWQLLGWRPFMWKLENSMETKNLLPPDIGPLPASVPGTVQKTLLAAGILEDWLVKCNSLACEWVEHRHWEYFTKLSGQEWPSGHRIMLAAEMLDYSGWILIDSTEIASFNGSLVPHRLDLTDQLRDGKEHLLRIIFDVPPREQGQVGFTSQSVHFKPRYNYSWDWCPRFVPIGISGPLHLLSDLDAEFRLNKVRCEFDGSSGRVFLDYDYAVTESAERLQLKLRLFDLKAEITGMSFELVPGSTQVVMDAPKVKAWWPNGCGEARTYQLVVEITDGKGHVLWRQSRNAGFKNVRWQPCQGAAADALPWICEVNGRAIFLQGVNWTPLLMNYADVPAEMYRDILTKYRDLGCNLLRVWGGALLETELFYDLCDELGLMVWQEFPLSSSGIDNAPPDSVEIMRKLDPIARGYIRRRAHHPSLLMWCGGNELMNVMGIPSSPSQPCLAMLGKIVEEEDPGRRFVHTSPSGPRFGVATADYGKGLHHDVHGPWGMMGMRGIDGWRTYWQEDDAMFRSEVGMPGASSEALIHKYCGDAAWPATNWVWRHSCAWHIYWQRFTHLQDLAPAEALQAYVRQTQQEQSETLAIAASACKGRFPRCGGILIWMGHDCFPCPINNSIIDFEGNCKPAYYALQEVFNLNPAHVQETA